MNENTAKWFIGGLLALILGMAICMPGGGGGCEAGPGGRPPRGGPEMGPEGGPPGGPMGPGGSRGPGPGADRIGIPEVRPGRPIPEYEFLPVPGQAIPMGCAPVTVTPLRDRAGGGSVRTPGIVAGDIKNNFGALVRGSPSAEQMAVMQKGLALIEAKYPGLVKGRDIYIFQDHEEYVRALIADGDSGQAARRSDAATSPDRRRIFFSPKAFDGGEKLAIYIIAHEFGHVQTRGGEGPADRFAEQLLGYPDPSKTGKSGNKRQRGQGGFVGVLDDLQNECIDCKMGWAA